jgi:hypothetical protein
LSSVKLARVASVSFDRDDGAREEEESRSLKRNWRSDGMDVMLARISSEAVEMVLRRERMEEVSVHSRAC